MESQTLDRLIGKHLGTTFAAMQLLATRSGEPIVVTVAGPPASQSDHPSVTMESLFDFASLTKLFTTSAFLALVTRGLVSIEEPVSLVIPEFASRSPRVIGYSIDPNTEDPLLLAPDAIGESIDPGAVTFRHLLTHTGGLLPWTNLFRLHPPDSLTPAATRQRTVIAAIAETPFADRIGRAVHYSDLGFILIGEAVARLHGKPLDEAIAELVTGPLRLDSIKFQPLAHGIPPEQIMPTEVDSRWRQRRCWGEVHDENAFGSGGVSGHAGLFGTAIDLARFGEAWLNHAPNLGISNELMDEATSEQVYLNGARRGLGWMLKPDENASCGERMSRDSFGHTGFTGTSLWIDPSQRLVVALLTNRVYFGRDADGISRFRPAVHDVLADSAVCPEG